jgi:hypothetical protein
MASATFNPFDPTQRAAPEYSYSILAPSHLLKVIRLDIASTIASTLDFNQLQVNDTVTTTRPGVAVHFHHVFVRPSQVSVHVTPASESRAITWTAAAHREVGPVQVPPLGESVSTSGIDELGSYTLTVINPNAYARRSLSDEVPSTVTGIFDQLTSNHTVRVQHIEGPTPAETLPEYVDVGSDHRTEIIDTQRPEPVLTITHMANHTVGTSEPPPQYRFSPAAPPRTMTTPMLPGIRDWYITDTPIDEPLSQDPPLPDPVIDLPPPDPPTVQVEGPPCRCSDTVACYRHTREASDWFSRNGAFHLGLCRPTTAYIDWKKNRIIAHDYMCRPPLTELRQRDFDVYLDQIMASMMAGFKHDEVTTFSW